MVIDVMIGFAEGCIVRIPSKVIKEDIFRFEFDGAIHVLNREQIAWERVNWYDHCWVAEDYHQGLKTGC